MKVVAPFAFYSHGGNSAQTFAHRDARSVVHLGRRFCVGVKLRQGAVLGLVLGRVVGPQVVESEAPGDHLVLQGLDQCALPCRVEPAVRVWVTVPRDENVQATLRPGQGAEAAHQVCHAAGDGHVLHFLSAVVLLGAQQADHLAVVIDLRKRHVDELNAA